MCRYFVFVYIFPLVLLFTSSFQIYIYIIYIYIYIYIYSLKCIMGENNSKNDLIIPNQFRPWPFSKDTILNVIYNKILCYFYVSWLMYVRFLVHMQKEEIKSEHCGYCITWYQFSSCFKPYGVKVLSFFDPKMFSFFKSQSQCCGGGSIYILQLFNYYKFAMFTECMFIVIEMFTCFYGTWFFMPFM